MGATTASQATFIGKARVVAVKGQRQQRHGLARLAMAAGAKIGLVLGEVDRRQPHHRPNLEQP
ncbi:hypothetical protein E2562_006742 [Oryza meyeriana var. granulata]|uniref:Uncharacterized protein n=1 Tax=Oryza meyeriana var. granulata TaxID=110450 RepID=A0A6G1EGR1_9ORYZ|nr:hypothetical protein E2562_006742 [Oryza meyeriana var. granulata]